MTGTRKLGRALGLTLTVLAVSLVLSTPPALSTQMPNVIRSNEAATIATLRQVAAAQTEFKQALDIDADCDGVGEYGYFAELAGTKSMRVGSGGWSCVPTSGRGLDILSPPLLRNALGMVTAYSVVVHQGYVFEMWLPAPEVGGVVGAIEEDPFGGKMLGPYPDPITGAQHWCCYAWPLVYGQTGRRAYFINQRGKVLRDVNRSATPFSGIVNIPEFDEAFLVPDDMSSPIRVGIPGGSAGSIWSVLP